MSLVSTPAPLCTAQCAAQARARSIGYLALTYAGKCLPLQVRHSAAGHYIGTSDDDGPVSRESIAYFRSYHAADHALTTGRWQQCLNP